MGKIVAKKHKHLRIRNGRYEIRVPVPKPIQEIIGKKEVTRSLKTPDFQEANKLYPDKYAEILKQFEIAVAELDGNKPVSLVGFSPLETVNDWFHIKHAKITTRNKSDFGSNEHLKDHKHGLISDLAELMSPSVDRRYHAVQFTADKLLLEKGYPVRKGTQFTNVDTTDPKYDRFLEYLITAHVELTEYELRRLGEKITQTPNGRIFWRNKPSVKSSLQSGTTLSKLISDYMSNKGSRGKKKTIDDKHAAFRYLTELVGENFFVENLSHDQFMQIHKLLSAYPKNARNQKVLNGKSLQEISEYAQKHNLPMMSKQNANKIIARLKSLMEYAVSTNVISYNPCKEIEFHISDAEKEAAARLPFSDDQLQKLFTSQVFKKNYPHKPAMFWVPLIALFHGFRMEEILILTLDEVKYDEATDVRYFDLTEFTTDDVKNSNARRRVPFNPIMRKLGFDSYLEACKNNKGRRLFPELKKGSDGSYRKRFTVKFSKYSKKVGVHTKQTVFHSFRHNFSVACSNGEVPVDYENALAGWTLQGGQKGTYKKPKDLALGKLAEMMARVEYPKLDLSHLYVN